MITRPNARIQAACIVLFLMLAPGTAASQEEPGDAGAPAAPAPQAAPSEQPVPPAEAEQPVHGKDASTEYVIKQGDTLWDISNAFFQDPFLWPFIWKANPAITNPDLIFAGNRLIIPSLAPIERAMRTAEEPREQLVQKEAPPPEEAAGLEEQAAPPQPAEPTPVETVPAADGLILPGEPTRPLIDKYSMLSAGFVNDLESGDKIVGAQEPGKTTLGYDDLVFVEIAARDNVRIGDKFLIYTPLDVVIHPKTRRRVGRLIRGLGILQITAKDPAADVLTARVTISFDTVETGHLLTPYQEPALVHFPTHQRAKDIAGYILELPDGRSISGQADIVYLDKGRTDGVDPADSFLVYAEPEKRGFPRKVIGEVQVFIVKEHTSTAVVRYNTDPLSKGDAIEFKK